MPREQGDSGEFVETVPPEDVLDVFDAVDGPVILSADVAEYFDVTRETARRKLQILYDRGTLDRRKVSRRVIYWRAGAAESGRESGPTPTPTEPPGEGDRREDAGETPPEDADPDVTVPDAGGVDTRTREAVEAVAETWDDDDRLPNRKRAAAATLQYAIDTGEAVGKSHAAVDAVRDVYPVEGQNEETYWRQNLRPILREYGEYSRATKGYDVAEGAIDA